MRASNSSVALLTFQRVCSTTFDKAACLNRLFQFPEMPPHNLANQGKQFAREILVQVGLCHCKSAERLAAWHTIISNDQPCANLAQRRLQLRCLVGTNGMEKVQWAGFQTKAHCV